MKHSRITKMAVLAISVCLATTFFASRQAMATIPYANMSKTHCTVVNSLWGLKESGLLTLPRAMSAANEGPGSQDYMCGQEIGLAVPEIAMKTPITIRASGSSNQHFLLRGGCYSVNVDGNITKEDTDKDGECDAYDVNNFTILNAKNVPTKNPCAVVLVGNEGNYVQIENIIVKNVPAGMSAICMDADYAIMENVRINGVGGDGFVMGPNAQGNVIKATSSLQSVDGRGVVIYKSSEGSKNNIDPFDGTMGLVDPTTGLAALTPPDGEKFLIETTGDGPEDWIVSGNPVQVRIIDKSYVPASASNPDPYVRIDGFVARGTEVKIEDIVEDATQEDLCDATLYPGLPEVKRIHIYEVGGMGGATNANIAGGFTDFIGHNIGYGGLNPTTGYFRINLPADYGSGLIFLVSETGGTLGRPSHIIHVTAAMKNKEADDDIDCPNRPFNSTGFDDDIVGVGGKKKMFGLQHCCEVRGIISMQCGDPTASGGTADGYDTDGDDIPDDVEDANWNCVWDEGETKFFDVDSDGDGLIDKPAGSQFGERNDMHNDADGLSNALDDDSDGDGRLDGEEDRNIHFQTASGIGDMEGYLYRISAYQNKQPVFDMTNTAKKIPLMCTIGYESGVGVKYVWYKVTCKDKGCSEYAANPEEVGSWQTVAPSPTDGSVDGETQPATFTSVEQLACRNRSLGYWKNFDGQYQADNFETNPFDWDSDGDMLCDGGGAGCGNGVCTVAANGTVSCVPETPLEGIDSCPTVNDPTDQCADIGQCYPDEVFYAVAYDSVAWNSDGSPSGMLDVNPKNNVPDLFEQAAGSPLALRNMIKQSCPSDMDGDGIPDCVEQPFAVCPPEGSQDLRYYAVDSDGDSINDNLDVCPESNGANDNFVEGGDIGQYSCNPYIEVYADKTERRVLALFIDRDGDGLKDGEEDRDMNGIGFDGSDNNGGKSITYEVLMAIETNPLRQHSDGDLLTDYEEVNTPASQDENGVAVYTNPRNKDTDGDGADDSAEDRDGDGKFTISNKNVAGSEGCENAMGKDTDPTDIDTDDDTLQDGIELKGDIISGQAFLTMIGNDEMWDKLGGIDSASNPLSADSDNDGLNDAEEYNDFIKYEGSNPCMRDSDNDSIDDVDELPGCRLNPSPTCVGGEDYVGKDTDSDGLSDICEAKFIDPASGQNLDANNQDSDGDGVKDGDEDINHNCIYEPNLNETNPFEQDTDTDGLTDGFELKYGTDPVNPDTDGDCLTDGVEDKNKNGQYDMGSETNALSVDTDNDGLPDGYTAATGLGEDINCNGNRDSDGKGNYTETDPVNPDSDNDGNSDGQEIGGNMANLSTALNREGCMSIADTASAGPSSMYYLFAMLVMATKIAARRMRRRTGRTPA